MQSAARVGCVIMAAGNAARFGENKLEALLDGRSLIRRAFDAVPEGLFHAVVVVTQYDRIEALAETYGFSCVRNRHPELGLSHTVCLGTGALGGCCDAILYMVADQPLLTAATVRRLVTAWRENPEKIVSAACGGRRGNPCVFPRAFFPELQALCGDRGGSAVIRRHEDRLLALETGALELSDCDTREALQQLQEAGKYGKSSEKLKAPGPCQS